MPRLTPEDFEHLLFAINHLNSDITPETLPSRTLECVLSLIPNEMTVFDGFDTENNYTGYFWYSPPGTVSDEKVQLLGELLPEHPGYQDLVLKRVQKTARASQYR